MSARVREFLMAKLPPGDRPTCPLPAPGAASGPCATLKAARLLCTSAPLPSPVHAGATAPFEKYVPASERWEGGTRDFSLCVWCVRVRVRVRVRV